MTNPDQNGQLGFNFAAVKGPDGKPWVAITVIAPPMIQFIYVLPEHNIDEYCNALRGCGDEARRANLGLVTSTVIPPTGKVQ